MAETLPSPAKAKEAKALHLEQNRPAHHCELGLASWGAAVLKKPCEEEERASSVRRKAGWDVRDLPAASATLWEVERVNPEPLYSVQGPAVAAREILTPYYPKIKSTMR